MGAHNNAFETFGFFAAGVVIAHLCNADAAWSADFAIAWVVLRIAHGILYLSNIDIARSLSFGLAQLCTIALFVLAARA